VEDGAFCGTDCKGSTWQGSILYFPEGKYLISQPIIMSYYTIITGHPVHRPTIIGSANFAGIALIDTNMYIENGWGNTSWINTDNFNRQIRNVILDIENLPDVVHKGADPVSQLAVLARLIPSRIELLQRFTGR
jgi:hypothetical protein